MAKKQQYFRGNSNEAEKKQILQKIILLILFLNIFCVPTGQAKEFLAGYIAKSNPNQADFIADRIMHYSQEYGVDYLFVTAVFKNENNFRVDAVSSQGAVGVAQLMPDTARGLQKLTLTT